MVEIKGLRVSAPHGKNILRGIDLQVNPLDKIAITGASGSGKSTLLHCILGFDQRSSLEIEGEIWLDGVNIGRESARKRRALCGRAFGYIPQNPMSSFFPYQTLGEQMVQTLRIHEKIQKASALEKAKYFLSMVRLENPARVVDAYPRELSGGMLQRVTLAIALALDTKYIFADEPTSALDHDNRRAIIDIFQNLEDRALVLVTHNAEVLYRMNVRTHIMVDGKLVEKGLFANLIDSPQHPWTKTFARSIRNREEILWR